MKLVFSIFAVVLFFSSCSTAYRSGQTPDDVYYSPDRPQNEEYVRVDDRNDRQYRSNNNQYNSNRYDDSYGYDDDRYLRMRVRNPRMWSDLDYYYNDPFAFNYNSPFRNGSYIGIYSVHPYAYSYYNPYSFWNNNFNPYYSPYSGFYGNRYGKVIVGNPRPQVYNRPRTSNLNIFNNSSNAPANSPRNSKPRTYRVTNDNYNRRNTGDNMRDVFGNSDRNSSRTYDNSSNNSSRMNNSSNSNNNSSNNSNRSSGGSAPARRF